MEPRQSGVSSRSLAAPRRWSADSKPSVSNLDEDMASSLDSCGDNTAPALSGLDGANVRTSMPSIASSLSTNSNEGYIDVFQAPPTPAGGGKLSGKKRFSSGNRPRGQGGKFPGKKKSTTEMYGRKRGRKPTKLKTSLPATPTSAGPSAASGTPPAIDVSLKDDEPQVETKMILIAAKDEFVLSQDLCVMCGSLGRDEEGRLIACSQCGQAYHPYCVNIKVNRVILDKGWRCLDCTVCEGCGQPTDESRLLLCDECDISYHTYCLTPPLDEVPQGTWKCANCVVCLKCSSTDSGKVPGALWQKNYTECGPCASQSTCPACEVDYQEGETIIECANCTRWYHSRCDGMMTEDDCELAADYGYNCLNCRGKDETPPHILARRLLLSKLQPSLGQRSSSADADASEHSRRPSTEQVAINSTNQVAQVSVAETQPNQAIVQPAPPQPLQLKPQKCHTQDGVLLSDAGLNMIKSLMLEPAKRQRQRRKTGAKTEDGTNEQDVTLNDETSRDKNEEGNQEEGDGKKKRHRRLDKLGIGGFAVRARRGMSKDDDSFEVPVLGLGHHEDGDVVEKPKKRRRGPNKKKTQLSDTFPTYMQEAFFGTSLMQLKDNSQLDTLETFSDEERPGAVSKDTLVDLGPNEIKTSKSRHAPRINEPRRSLEDSTSAPFDEDLDYGDDLRDLLPLGTNDDELMSMLISESGEALDTKESLDELQSDVDKDGSTKDGMDFQLSPTFNLDSIDTGLPHMDGKDVEDLFKGVLSPTSGDGDSSDFTQPLNSLGSLIINPGNQSLGIQSRASGSLMSNAGPSMTVAQQQVRPLQAFSQHSPSIGGPLSSGHVSPGGSLYSSVTAGGFSQDSLPSMAGPSPSSSVLTDSHSPFDMGSSQFASDSADEPSQGQKNLVKWFADEQLGTKASISPVLYANVAHPNLKEDFPSWPDRCKQIHKLWRQLPADGRKDYLQQARENRAALRLNKTPGEPRAARPPSPGVQRPVQRPVPETEQERQWKNVQARQQSSLQDQLSPSLPKMGAQPGQQQMHQEMSPFEGGHPNVGPDGRPAMYGHAPNDGQPPQQQIRMPQVHQMGPSGQVRSLLTSTPPGMSGPPPMQQRVRPLADHLRGYPHSQQQMPFDPYAAPVGTPRPPQSGPGPLRMISQRPPFSPSSPQTPLTPLSGDGQQQMFHHTPPPRPQSRDQFPPGQQMQGSSQPTTPGGMSGPPPSPFLAAQQPKTPVPNSPFSPSTSAGPPGTPEAFANPSTPMTPRPSSQPHPPPLSPMGAPFSPMTSEGNRFSPAPRLTPSRSSLDGQQYPDQVSVSSPYARAPNTPTHPSQDGSPQFQAPQAPGPPQSISSHSPNTADPYSHMVGTPRPGAAPQPGFDPYSQMVGTPRPPGQFRSGGQMIRAPHPQDPYDFQPGTPRPPQPYSGHSRMMPPQQMRPQMQQDPFAQQPGTPMPMQSPDPYDNPPRTPFPGREQGEPGPPQARQQLRDLLQSRKQESPMRDGSSQWMEGQMNRPRMQMQHDAQGQPIRGPMSHGGDAGFRAPFPPHMRARMMGPPPPSGPDQQIFRRPGDSRMVMQPRMPHPGQAPDPRMQRQMNPSQIMAMRQQQAWAQQQQQRLQGQRMPHPGQQMQEHQGQPYGPRPLMQGPPGMVQQYVHPGQGQVMGNQRPQMSYAEGSGPMVSSCSVRGPMPPGQQMPGPPQMMRHPHPSQQMAPGQKQDEPKATTVEIVKQLQETTGDLPDPDAIALPEDLDDDELLGLGNDFNILEYADPELDKIMGGAGGSKNNIFDEHFDEIEFNKKKEEAARLAAANHGGLGKTRPDIPSPVPPMTRHPGPGPNQQVMPTPGTLQGPQPQNVVRPPPPYPGQHPGQQQPQQQLPAGHPQQQQHPGHPQQVRATVPPPPYDDFRQGPGPSHQQGMPPHPQMVRGPRPPYQRQDGLCLEELVDKKEEKPLIAEPGSQSAEHFQAPSETLLSDFDFERLKADILSDDGQGSPMQSPTGPPPIQPFGQQPPQHGQHWHGDPNQPPQLEMGHHPNYQQGQPMSPMAYQQGPPMMRMRHQGPPHAMGGPQMPMGPRMSQVGHPQVRMPPPQPLQGHPAMMQTPRNMPGRPAGPQRHQVQTLPEPPQPSGELTNEHDFKQAAVYDKWIVDNEKLLMSQQNHLINEQMGLRKTKKGLNVKSRQLKKNNQDLGEVEAIELEQVTQALQAVAKSVDQVKRKLRQHTQNTVEYRTKQSGIQRLVGQPQLPSTAASPGQMVHSPGPGGMMIGSHPRPSHSPMVMGGPGTPGTPHSTPQSPALMSPSPGMGPSPSPSHMQHSPATSMSHSPAHNVPPASPMIHSPMIQSPMTYPQQPSPMTPHGHGGPEDNNPFSDAYQKERMQMQHGGAPPGSHPAQQQPQQVRGQMQGHPSQGYPPQQPYDGHPQQGPPQQGPYRMQGPHGPGPQPGLRYMNPQQQQQGHPRPYGDMVGQPYPATGPGGKPPMMQHQYQQRRMAPPPYPGQYQQGPPQQQQQPQQQGYMQPQQQMRYNHPPAMMQQRHPGPGHESHPQMQHHPQQQQHSQQPQQMHHMQQQQMGQPRMPQQMGMSPRHEIVTNPAPQHMMQGHAQQHHHQQPPQLHPQQQQHPQQVQQQQHAQEFNQQMHPQHQQQPNPQQQQMQHPPQEFKHEQQPMDEVGEAKTSMTLHFEEKGAGEDNDAVNESIIEQPQVAEERVAETSNQGTSSTITVTQIKTEPGLEKQSSCDASNQQTVEIKAEERSFSDCVHEQQKIVTEVVQEAKSEPSQPAACSMSMGEGDPLINQEQVKQNALLKQLLQNCPSADAESKPNVSGSSDGEQTSSRPGSAAAVIPEVLPPANVPVPTQNAIAVTIETKSETPKMEIETTPVETTSTPSAAVTVRSDSMTETTVIEITTPLAQSAQNINSSNNMASVASNNQQQAHQVVNVQGPPAPIERKMSYLDIRRAQLEREPTPPPESSAPKPKRKRIIKEKKEKKEKKEVVRSDVVPGPSTSTAPAPPKQKRQRKASASRPDEDYDLFLKGLMAQLRALPPMPVIEPQIRPNYNMCSVFGAGDLNVHTSVIRGTFGHGFIPTADPEKSFAPAISHTNFASPSGPRPPGNGLSASGSGMGLRGFYDQEFSRATRTQVFTNEYSCYLREARSPESIVSGSSPDIEQLQQKPMAFGKLRVIVDSEDEQDGTRVVERRPKSPEIPLLAPIAIKSKGMDMKSEGVEMKGISPRSDASDFDKENSIQHSKVSKAGNFGQQQSGPLRDAGNVAVTLTLSSDGDGDIKRILGGLAKILGIEAPTDYQVLDPKIKRSLDDAMEVDDDRSSQNKFCRFCDVEVRDEGIKKKIADSQLSASLDNVDDEVLFCSANCYMKFAMDSRGSNEEKTAGSLVSHLARTENDIMMQMSPFMEEDTTMASITSEGSPMVAAVPEKITTRAASWPDEEAMLAVRQELKNKKWKEVRYKAWTPNTFEAKNPKDDENEAEIGALLDSLAVAVKPNDLPPDERSCVFCHEVGDGVTDGPGRLLNMDIDTWVHLNCALWSGEVYETVNGALINVDNALKRCVAIVCVKCHRNGASLKCYKARCANVYHLACAVGDKCTFFKDKTLFCPAHVPKAVNPEAALDSFIVNRRVYINRDEHKQLAAMIHQGEQQVMRIGSMTLMNIGQLLPHQLMAFHTANCIYPVGYRINRFYWSSTRFGKRCKYVCSIEDHEGRPMFVVEVLEEGKEPVVMKDASPRVLWQKLVEPIAEMRREKGTIKVFADCISGEDLFGLTELSMVRILESLPGVDTLSDYHFRYGRAQFLELPLAINPSGCARCEPKLRTHFKRTTHTLHTSNPSRSSLQSSFNAGLEIQSPYVKQFVHSKSFQYRKMKTEWRNNVFLARSRIAGLGLYAAKDIEKHTMVIEYIGQLIRNEIAERNERIYTQQNRGGVYMFRLDSDTVLDATLSGGLARYVNHSCNPNCVAEVVQIDRENKILIIANRRIAKGEELSYDYRFSEEDEAHKIQCLCGAINCRKWMN